MTPEERTERLAEIRRELDTDDLNRGRICRLIGFDLDGEDLVTVLEVCLKLNEKKDARLMKEMDSALIKRNNP